MGILCICAVQLFQYVMLIVGLVVNWLSCVFISDIFFLKLRFIWLIHFSNKKDKAKNNKDALLVLFQNNNFFYKNPQKWHKIVSELNIIIFFSQFPKDFTVKIGYTSMKLSRQV